jgi:hypothetical protein
VVTRGRWRLAVVAYACLMAAWVVGNPPFAAPDEWAHYLRALGLAQGAWVGEPTRDYEDANLSEQQLGWVVQATRVVPVPEGLSPLGFGCNTFRPEQSAGCLPDVDARPEAARLTTPTGTYPPALYVLPGLAALRGTSPVSALLAGRAASALVCLVLLAGMFAALWREEQGALSLVGPALALTPLAVALSATLNTSGPEILSGMAFFAALLRLTRAESPPRWVWGFAAGAGAVLALSRSMGTVWVAADVLLVLLWRGPGALLAQARARPVAAGVTAVVLALSLGLNRLWEALYGPRVHVGFERLRPAWKQARLWWPDWLREQVGVFQYLDAPMPAWAYVAWTVLLVGLLGAALGWGRARDRVWLVLTLAGALFAPVLLYIALIRHNGWTVQGRHVLPLTAVLPLLAGEVLVSRVGASARARAWAIATVAGVAVLQGVAWWANAHRSAVGTLGPVWFWSAPEWSPPLGWWPWTVLVLAGAGLLVSAASPAWRAPRPPSTARR